MKLYIAGPLFTPGDRDYIERIAARLEQVGHECFVPHQQDFEPMDAQTIFAVDSAGLHDAEAVVAWLDGPMIDDGTACEIGIFTELIRTRPERYRGIVGLATDWRVWRQRDAGMSDGGLNFFVGGAIQRYGRLEWGLDGVEQALGEWDARARKLGEWASRHAVDAVQREVRALLARVTSAASLPSEERRRVGEEMVDIGVYLAEPTRQRTDKIVEDVDFPEFVAGLVNGVFDAIVGASIEQMEAYADLLAGVSKSVADFMANNATDDEARDHLAKHHPELFAMACDSSTTEKDPKAQDTSARQLLATMVLMGINRIVVTDGTIAAKLDFDL